MNEPLAVAPLVDRIRALGVERVHVLGWRDLDDDDAGGSERHADEVMRRWAEAGLEVTHRTSAAAGLPAEAWRHGYRVIRRGSRYSVFPRTAVAETLRRMGPADGLVEILNGVPWFSPVWFHRGPRMMILHHIHGPMWDQIMPRPLAGAGRFLEARIAPPFYRSTETVTPSEATRAELLTLGFRPELVTAVDNGIDEHFTPGGTRAAVPTVVAAARLAPVKRLDRLIAAVAAVREVIPGTELVIVGDGPERAALQAQAARLGGGAWVRFTGRVDRPRLREEYRRAWVVASASIAEGWGLSLTEAAACGTPAVATDIAGHRCSVLDGTTGLLTPPEGLAAALVRVLGDDTERARLAAHAVARAQTLTWERTAAGVTAVFLRACEARAKRR